MYRRRTSHEKWREQVPLAREFRRRATPAEAALWDALRDARLAGFKFRRQHPIGRFIVDFYCARAGVAIEIDGPVHADQAEADRLRQQFLESRNIAVLRFTNDDIERDLPRVLAATSRALADRTK